MADEAGLGVPGTNPAALPDEEQRSTMASAVRETLRAQVIELLERRGLAGSPDLVECPRCGDRIILLDQPATFAIDKADRSRICAACGGEADFLAMIAPEADIGGEAG